MLPGFLTGRVLYRQEQGDQLLVYGALNPLDKHADIILSEGNLKATKTGTSWRSVRSETSHSSGKYYYEWFAENHFGSFTAGGFANGSAVLTTFIGANANGIALVTNGSLYKNNVATGGYPDPNNGSVVGLAIDLDADLFWCRLTPTGNWNNNVSANPATGVGGNSLPSGLTSGNVFAAISIQASSDISRVNFGNSAFNGAMPSGFSVWG